jgi:pimeloyl-ACP methyl ester carboxylesterase
MKKILLSISTGKRCIYQFEPKGHPELYCIHGGMGLGSDSLIKSLGPLSDIFDLTFIDLRGCGDSEKAQDEQYALRDFTNDIIEIVKLVSKDGPRGIFGHSLGGMVGIDLLSQSDLFQFSILANTAMNDKWQPASRVAVQNMNDANLKNVLEQYSQSPNDETIQELAISYGPIYFPELEKSNAKEIMRIFRYRDDASLYTSSKVYPGMNLLPQVEKINIPTLIIAGTLDVVVPPSCQDELTSHLQKSNLISIKDAGHFPFITKNTEFIHSINNWWNHIREVIL